MLTFGILQAAAAQDVDVGGALKITLEKGIKTETETGHAPGMVSKIWWQRLRRRQVRLISLIEQPDPARLQAKQFSDLREYFLQCFVYINFAIEMACNGIENRQVTIFT